MNKNRDEFSPATKSLIARRASYICSNPSCHRLTISSSGSKTICIGVASHIYAAAPGGPRYNKNMTKEQRKAFDNGIWLCQTCSNFIDKDEKKYTAELLLKWKKDIEELIVYNFNKPIMLERENKLEFTFELLKFSEKWEPLADKDWGYYYLDNPAFTIYIEDDNEHNKPEYYSWLLSNESTLYGMLYIYYNNNCIFKTQTVCLDSGRCLTIVPETGFLSIENMNLPYKYMIKDSHLMILRDFIMSKNGIDNEEYIFAFEEFSRVVTQFNCREDQQKFEEYFKDKIQISDLKNNVEKYNYCGYTKSEKELNSLKISLGFYVKEKYNSLEYIDKK